MKQIIKTLTTFLSGGLCAVLIISLAVPSVAAGIQKTITVMTGINIYVDDIKLNPTDVNGKPVDVMLYNGTTYLPVRAVSQALGKNISWNGKTSSVFVGNHAADNQPACPLYDLDYFTSESLSSVSRNSVKDNLGQSRDSIAFKSSYGHGYYKMSVSYKLNGKYSALSGVYFLPFEYRSASEEINFSIYGDGKQLLSESVRGGVEPIKFNVDLRGVNNLELKFYNPGNYMPAVAYLGDTMLFT